MNVRRQSGAPSTSAHSASWIGAQPASFDAATLHVRLTDDSAIPPVSDLRHWIEHVRRDASVSTVRTAALFPQAAQRFRDAGFTVADTLALLRIDLKTWAASERTDDRRPETVPEPGAVTATLRRHHHQAAADIDGAAFGREWGHDAREIDDIRHATPVHRAVGRFQRTGLFGRTLLAFAVSGASTEHGYLQRLSVAPSHQREGHGRVLTTESLRWMHRRHVRDCLVNTSVANAAALALYRSVGFQLLTDCLEVLRFDLRRPA